MKNIKIPVTVILGIISIIEIAVTKDLSGSILLWVLYGFYKLAE